MNDKSQKLLNELKSPLQNNKIAFLVGAGVSAKRQSWLPAWGELTENMLYAIAGEKKRTEVELVKPHLERLLTEVIFQLMIKEIGEEEAFKPLKITMLSENFSDIHKFLAYFAIKHNAVILTTNYDILIETAAKKYLKNDEFPTYVKPDEYKTWDIKNGALMKLHGTITDLKTAKFAINQVFEGLNESIQKTLTRVLDDRLLIVAGYRGADEFDINPILFDHSRSGIVWLVREGSVPEPWIQTYLNSVGGRWISTNVDEFLEALYNFENSSVEEQDIEHGSHNERKNWKSQITYWGENLHQNHPGKVAFLWARILEYLYLYEPAADAYLEASQKLSGNKGFEADFRHAWMLRQSAKNDNEIKKALGMLQDIYKKIREELTTKSTSEKKAELENLLGDVVHQTGIALQSLKQFKEANSKLIEAEAIRSELDDRFLPYTVFQRFINARQSYKIKNYQIDELAPDNWREELSDYLEESSQNYKKEGFVNDYATTIHNLAFVHQFLAEEFEMNEKYQDAQIEFKKAWEYYLKGWHYRNRLYDRRYVAQSEVRLAECELGLARIFLEKGDKFNARFMAQSSFNRSVVIRELYLRIPQQEFRIKDVENIERESTRICKISGFEPHRSYLR